MTLTEEQVTVITEERKAKWQHGMEYLDYIKEVTERSTGSRAALRRCIMDREVTLPEAYSLVAPWAVNSGSRWLEEVHYCIAGLYATHGPEIPHLLDGSNFGSFCRSSAYRLGLDSGTFNTRFGVMLSGNREDLIKHLTETFALMKGSGVGIDWFVLMEDMRYWGEHVKTRWARNFWGQPIQNIEETEQGE